MSISNRRWVDAQASQVTKKASLSVRSTYSDETLPEVAVTGYIPSSHSSYDFWNLYYLLMDWAYYNDFASFNTLDSHAGDGNSSSSDQAPPSEIDPCAAMKALTAKNDFKSIMQDLAGKTGLDHEEGYIVTRNANGDLAYSHVSGNKGENFINFNFNTNTLGMIHSHYDGLSSMPSPGDLYQLGRIFASYSAESRIKLSGDFILGVVSSSGSYIFKIDNVEKFVSFYVYNLADATDRQRFESKYISQYRLTSGNASDAWENNFLKLLKDYDAGLKMYSGSNENKNWQEKTVNNFGNTANDGACKN